MPIFIYLFILFIHFFFCRFVSDSAACCCIGQAATYLISAHRQNLTKTAICWNLFGNGVFGDGMQLLDTLLFISRYRAVTTMSNLKLWLTCLWIGIVILLPYYSTVTFLPLFINTNAVPEFNTYAFFVTSFGTILYNVYYTYEFTVLMYGYIKNMITHSDTLKMIVIKSLIHCITSSIANSLLYCSGTYLTFYFDSMIFNMMILSGIHFLFNFKIESMFQFRIFPNEDNNLNIENTKRS